MQGARYRRGTHRQDVYVLLKVLDTFLVRNSKALFLVHDQQAEVMEHNVFREQPVCPEYDVHLPGREVFEHGLDLLRRAEAAEHLDADREWRKSSFERLVVLQAEDRRRREDRDLLAVTKRFEGGPHGYFRFAEADVATEQ